ncbi:hypothetical protein EON68_01015, partial [archaeon]
MPEPLLPNTNTRRTAAWTFAPTLRRASSTTAWRGSKLNDCVSLRYTAYPSSYNAFNAADGSTASSMLHKAQRGAARKGVRHDRSSTCTHTRT